MKKSNFLLSVFLMAGLLVALPVFAAQSDSSQTMNQPMNQPSMSQSHQEMNFHPFYTKDLLGKTVKDQKGKTIGKVADVVIGKDGRADFVVLSRGGMFSRGKYTPIPFKTFISSATNLNDLRKASYLKTSLSRAKIDKAPTYSSRRWNLTGSQDKICGYYGSGQCNRIGG
jgi:sporulation protein YlmC with PRC-barrel domain